MIFASFFFRIRQIIPFLIETHLETDLMWNIFWLKSKNRSIWLQMRKTEIKKEVVAAEKNWSICHQYKCKTGWGQI